MFFKDQVGSRLRTPGLRQLGPSHLQHWLPRKQAHDPNYGLFLQGQGCLVTLLCPTTQWGRYCYCPLFLTWKPQLREVTDWLQVTQKGRGGARSDMKVCVLAAHTKPQFSHL